MTVEWPKIDPRFSWYGLPDHPDKPTFPDPEDGEDRDYVGELCKLSEFWSEHPPTAPTGFWLVPCDATPRHWPEYVPIDTDFYEPYCSNCQYKILSDEHRGCAHSHHGRWRSWAVTRKVRVRDRDQVRNTPGIEGRQGVPQARGRCRMTAHRIRIAINSEGILCSVCDLPVRWALEWTDGHANLPATTRWEHVEPDPAELAASMARHPSGKGRA